MSPRSPTSKAVFGIKMRKSKINTPVVPNDTLELTVGPQKEANIENENHGSTTDIKFLNISSPSHEREEDTTAD